MQQAQRFTLRSRGNPRVASIMKAAMMSSALLIAGMAALLPRMGVDEPVITGALLFVAVTDFALAFFIPSIIEKKPGPSYTFYGDRVVVELAGHQYALPYENITAVEDETSPRHSAPGLAAARLYTKRPAGIPFLSDSDGVILSFLPAEDAPLGKIKEVVEKSRTS